MLIEVTSSYIGHVYDSGSFIKKTWFLTPFSYADGSV